MIDRFKNYWLTQNFDAKALKGFKKSDDFFACLNRASEEDYKYVEKKLQEDPKRFGHDY